jgi:hypothetical protein
MSECEAGASSLGLDNVAKPGSSSTAPYGCYYRASSSSGSRLWLNPSGTSDNHDSERTALCLKNPGAGPPSSSSPAKPSRTSSTITYGIIGGGIAFIGLFALFIRRNSGQRNEAQYSKPGIGMEMIGLDVGQNNSSLAYRPPSYVAGKSKNALWPFSRM